MKSNNSFKQLKNKSIRHQRISNLVTGHKNTQVFTFIFPYNCRAADQQKVEMDGEGGQQV